MNKVSDAAKAAAVRMFCSGVEDYDAACEIFNELGASHGPIEEVLDKYGAARWGMFDELDDATWWEMLELAAHDIDAAFDHFEFPIRKE